MARPGRLLRAGPVGQSSPLQPAQALEVEKGAIRKFADATRWTFAKTYARTWPHEYVVRTPENAEMIVALARHIFEHGIEGRFYAEVRPYHHEDGKVYWSMDDTPESTTLINRCDESQTYEARLAAGTLPSTSRTDPDRSRPTS